MVSTKRSSLAGSFARHVHKRFSHFFLCFVGICDFFPLFPTGRMAAHTASGMVTSLGQVVILITVVLVVVVTRPLLPSHFQMLPLEWVLLSLRESYMMMNQSISVQPSTSAVTAVASVLRPARRPALYEFLASFIWENASCFSTCLVICYWIYFRTSLLLRHVISAPLLAMAMAVYFSPPLPSRYRALRFSRSLRCLVSSISRFAK